MLPQRQRKPVMTGYNSTLFATVTARSDVAPVTALARQVWQQTYPGIISQEQIDFMLEQRYNPQRLLEELTMPSMWWDQARVDGQLAGFSSCLLTAGGREMKLDKLYVDPRGSAWGSVRADRAGGSPRRAGRLRGADPGGEQAQRTRHRRLSQTRLRGP
jgi:hypothetical protein